MHELWQGISEWHILAGALAVLLALLATGHALLYKRESRAVVAWLGFIWLAPVIGGALYFVLGVNRIKRSAVLLRGAMIRYRSESGTYACPPEDLHGHLPPDAAHLAPLETAVARVTGRPLTPGNRIEPLVDGDAAYPAMLAAIASATRSIALSTYIFDRDAVGIEFARALGDAVRRGVAVRVLIDATGSRYSLPSILSTLREEHVPYARHLPAYPWRLTFLNLRNHRKLLVVDGRVGFTGGMNIRVGHWLSRRPAHPVRDVQFRVEGPVVAQMQEVFADDWMFTTREALRGDDWFPMLDSAGATPARAVVDGPDEDIDKLRWAILAALGVARRSVRIVTPYFLPDPSVIAALNVAALRGVQVEIVLPGRSNLPFAHWASAAQWWQVLEHGCRIRLTPPPFDHTKLLVVDDAWTLIGTSNWDPRSFRLNFEFNIECYDRPLAHAIGALIDARVAGARDVTLRDVDGRPLPVRLRDGIARLFTPYL
ncbi:MAG TPA: phospholipase D-like domain-containing protein [Gemmatimonadaceae bacterium]|nr:phospholipase D-like domain-containing protein [Gemmatimonadaceae bacterium]